MARTVLPPYLDRALVGGGVLRAVASRRPGPEWSRDSSSGTPMPAVGVRGSLPGPPGCQAPEHAFCHPPWKSSSVAGSQMSGSGPRSAGRSAGSKCGVCFCLLVSAPAAALWDLRNCSYTLEGPQSNPQYPSSTFHLCGKAPEGRVASPAFTT